MPATNEIGIVVYPGVQAAPVHGLTDLFGIAASIAVDQQRDDTAFRQQLCVFFELGMVRLFRITQPVDKQYARHRAGA